MIIIKWCSFKKSQNRKESVKYIPAYQAPNSTKPSQVWWSQTWSSFRADLNSTPTYDIRQVQPTNQKMQMNIKTLKYNISLEQNCVHQIKTSPLPKNQAKKPLIPKQISFLPCLAVTGSRNRWFQLIWIELRVKKINQLNIWV